jgi:hypothetical protein
MRRKYCVIWTKETRVEKPDYNQNLYKDYSVFFEDGELDEATELYEKILNEENTFCASLCQILKDSED